jgi:cytochrome c oxidase subunit 5b
MDQFGKFRTSTDKFTCILSLKRTMLQAAVRAAVRPAAQASRSTLKSTSTISKTAFRALSTTSTRLSGDHHVGPPKLFGPGAPPGEVPSDELQATGLERLELLAEMQGESIFDEGPLDSSRLGTMDDPVKVFSLVGVLPVSCVYLFSTACNRIRSALLDAQARQPTLMRLNGST